MLKLMKQARAALSLMSADEIMSVAVRMRGMQQSGLAGPLAIVMPRERYDQFARLLGILAVPERPMQFFRDAESAQTWLDQPEVRSWSGGASKH